MSWGNFALGLAGFGGFVYLLDSIMTDRVKTDRSIRKLSYADQKNQAVCEYLEDYGQVMADDQLNHALRLLLCLIDKGQGHARKRL